MRYSESDLLQAYIHDAAARYDDPQVGDWITHRGGVLCYARLTQITQVDGDRVTVRVSDDSDRWATHSTDRNMVRRLDMLVPKLDTTVVPD